MDRTSRGLSGVSFSALQDYRSGSISVFEDIAGYTVGFLGLASDGARPDRVLVTEVTGNYFSLLDLQPAHGRLIRPDEGGRGRTDAVAVLGHSTWRTRFGADPAVVGTIVRVNGRPLTVVGVAPEGFAGTFAFSESEVYLPVNWAGGDGLEDRRSRGLHAIARLRPGVGIEEAQATMNVVAGRLAREYPDSSRDVTVRVVPERLARPREAYETNVLGAAMMLGLVALVMIVATVNVTNLMVARTITRRQEIAIRTALGARPARIVRQLVTESLMLSAMGGGAGLLAGTWAAGVLATLRLPGDLPVRFDFHLDARVLAYASAIALVTGLAVGVAAGMRISGLHLDTTLRHSRYTAAGAGRARVGGLLVVAQIACCLVLLVAAGLFVRSLMEAERRELGFQPDPVLNAHMDVAQLGYTEAQGRALFDDIHRRVRSLPGVEEASFAFTIPMGYIFGGTEIETQGGAAGAGQRIGAGKNNVSAGYFETMGIPLTHGRTFREADDAGRPPVAIVNRRLADMLWPGRDPVGQRFRYVNAGSPWIEVVGVTSTGKYAFLFEEPEPYFYVPLAQEYTALRVLQVRTSTPHEVLIPTIERAIRELEPNLPLYDVQGMRQALGSGLGFFPVRVGAASAAALGLLALALALVGLYGVVSHVASQRTHEIGVRMAMGANQRDVVRLIARDGVELVAYGVGAGSIAALVCARLIESFLFDVSPYDPTVFVSLPLIFAGVAVIACAIPGWRAARVDPTIALRSE
jgi:predicted permease